MVVGGGGGGEGEGRTMMHSSHMQLAVCTLSIQALGKRLYFHGYTPYWKGMERYKEGPYFLNFLEIWPFLIPFHTFPIRSIVMEIQSFFPVKAVEPLQSGTLGTT